VPHRTRQGSVRIARILAMALSAIAGVSMAGGVATAVAEPASGPPLVSSLPSLKGSATDGKKLKATRGVWSGAKPIAYSYGWQLCSQAGDECTTIASARAGSYPLVSADIGHTLRALVTASNPQGAATATSLASSTIAPVGPRRRKSATISGLAQDGQVLTVVGGTWKGSQPMSFTYQWQACRSGACSAIAGATQASYRANSSQLGEKLRAIVTATNGAGSKGAASKTSAKVVAGPPVSLVAPSVTGIVLVGQTVTADVGEWGGTGPFEYSYQWRTCNLLGECSDVAGATASTYTVSPLDVASSVEVVVSAANSLGSSSATSAPTNAVDAVLPTNTGLPSIAGLLQDGDVLSALTGGWTGTEPLSFGYQWELCNAAGAGCEAISSAVASTLGLLAGDVGSTLRVIVTATNTAGSTSATSEPTSLVSALLPSNTGLPSIAGLLQDGGTLSALTGSWSGTGPLSYSYQWQLCNASGASCEAISSASASTLALLAGEVGSTVRVVVTASNGAGSTSASSEATNPVKALLPSNTALPSITGILQDGGLLSSTTGGWSGTGPLSYSYQWQLCNAAGTACKGLAEAVTSTLSLLTGEIGSTLRVVVTATNSGGSTSATSEATSVVKALLPSNTGLPPISGLAQDGASLTAAKGSWSGSEPLSYSYQWQLCNASGGACKNIAEAVGSTLGLLAGDVGSTLRVVVTATNAAGSTSASSEATSLVKALLPSNTTLPSIGGLLQMAQLLSATKGGWTGTEPISYSYQWQLCGALGGGCGNVSKATEPTFKLVLTDVGLTLRVIVTATNAAGSTSATSAVTGLISGLL
jgi:hypothetical protein